MNEMADKLIELLCEGPGNEISETLQRSSKH